MTVTLQSAPDGSDRVTHGCVTGGEPTSDSTYGYQSQARYAGQLTLDTLLGVANRFRPFEFDVALSFAGEDRQLAEALATQLRAAGVAVFYDRYEQARLWGKDLYQHLQSVYKDRARYCVVFVSQHYARKLWTSHELRQAQARAFSESQEYLLPIRLDDTALPGVNETVGYVDAREIDVGGICDLLLEKLAMSADAIGLSTVVDQEDGPELLDLRVEMDDAFQGAMATLGQISRLSAKEQESILRWKDAADSLVASGSKEPRKAFNLVNERAAAFAEHAASLTRLVREYRRQTDTFFTALGSLADHQIASGLSTRDELLQGLHTLSKADDVGRELSLTYTKLAEAASLLTAPTKAFRKARDAYASSVRSFVAAVEHWLSRSELARMRLAEPDGTEAPDIE